jgi:hypothetical protein
MFVAFAVRLTGDLRYRPRWSSVARRGQDLQAQAYNDAGAPSGELTSRITNRCTDAHVGQSAMFAGEVADETTMLKLDWQGTVLEIPVPAAEARVTASVEIGRDLALVSYQIDHPQGLPVLARLVQRGRDGARSAVASLVANTGSARVPLGVLEAGIPMFVEVTDGRFLVAVPVGTAPESVPQLAPLVLRPQPDDLLLRGEGVRALAIEPTSGAAPGIWWSSIDGDLVEGASCLLSLSPGEHQLEYRSDTGTASVGPIKVVERFTFDS